MAILFILTLEIFSVFPVIGNVFKNWAENFQGDIWEGIKDNFAFLTDPSDAATAREIVERGIIDLATQDLESIHLFAHSLGTVIAYDTLVHLGRDAGALIRKNDAVHAKIKSLVTYGSPLNKVRMLANKATEAAQSDPPVEIMPGFDCTRFDDNAILPQDRRDFRWLNHFSPHDFVSDTLSQYHKAQDPDSRGEDPTIPHEYWTPSANDLLTAHGAYWDDKEFWRANLQ
ncbi:MAG: alpha/beta hydrolase, partial [Chloroflexi bacterium]|nr:alpha/beta hydrolase [Chloroflexota bacterium]